MSAIGEAAAQPQLSVEIERRSADVTVLRFTGEIDRVTAVQVQSAVLGVLRQDPPREVLLDLGAVSFLDSSGIRALLTCQKRAGQGGVVVEVSRAHDIVRQVFGITGLLEVFNVADGDGCGSG